MKWIRVIKGQGSRWKTAVGDEYESKIIVYDENNEIIYETDNASVVPSKKFKGGVIANGEYGGICGIHSQRIKAILIFRKEYLENFYEKKLTWQKVNMNLQARVLPSERYNPTQNGYIMSHINIHDGGELPWGTPIPANNKNIYTGTNFSKGCIVIKRSDYQKFIDLFKINEYVKITIEGGLNG